MAVIAIGVDICEVERIREIESQYKHRFLQKVFTNSEIEYCENKVDKYYSLAGRFAAKEALLKSLGTGLRDGLQWKDIEIKNDTLGKPFFRFYGKVLHIISERNVLLSLSHTNDNAIAFVIIEGEPFSND